MGHKEVCVTHLRKIMLEELQRRNYADETIRHYLHVVDRSLLSTLDSPPISLVWNICVPIRRTC